MNMQTKMNDYELQEKAKELNEELQKYQKLNNLLFFIIIISMVLATVAYAISNQNEIAYILVAIIMVFLVFFYYAKIKADSYKNKIKELIYNNNFIFEILSEYFEVKSYDKENHISKDVIKNSELTEKYNKFYGSDYVKANYKGMDFEFSDIKLIMSKTDRTSENLQKKERAVLSGLWLICNTDFNFSSRLTIKEKVGSAKIFNNSNSEYTNNSNFNNRYIVQAQDEELALKILNAKFINSILELNDRLNGFLKLDFYENKITVTIHNTKDNFEIDFKNNEAENINRLKEKYKKEVEYILEILDFIKENIAL